MFSKVKDLQQDMNIASAENMADTLQNIGSALHLTKDFPMAAKWLRRAFEVIDAPPLDRLSVEGLDSRLAICQDLVQALLGTGDTDAVYEANNLVTYIEGEIGDKPIVLHWRLEILQKTPDETSDSDSYASIIRQMIHVFDSTDQTFQFLLHHVQELRSRNTRLAGDLLNELILKRVLPACNIDWLDKSIVRKVWLSTMESGSSGKRAVRELSELLNRVMESIGRPLSAEVAGAAQSVSLMRYDLSL